MKELQLDEELSTLELSKLPQDQLIDEFYQDEHIDQGEQGIQDQDTSTTTASTESKESIKQSEQNSEDSTDEMFQSFASRGGESSPEQLINAHFDLENLQEEELDRLLQDEADITSAANEKPGRSASTETSLERNIEPEPEKVVQAADLEKPQEEDLWIRRRNSLVAKSSKSASK